MNREDIIRMAREAHLEALSQGKGMHVWHGDAFISDVQDFCVRFAALVAEHERNACVQIIEEYRIPVGNSRSGELAYEWTYAALKEIRDDIRARGKT